MESTLAFLDGNSELLSKNIHGTVIWHFEVVDTCHDTGEVIVRCVRRFAWLANDREHWCEALES
jgi:hypothetical protein